MTREDPIRRREEENVDRLLAALSRRRREASGYLPWEIGIESIGVGDADAGRGEAPRGDLAMVKSMRAVLEEQGHPFPEFGALLRVLRLRHEDRSQQAWQLLEIPLALYLRYERGEVPPEGFPADSVRRASALMGPLQLWTDALIRSLARPAVDAGSTRQQGLPARRSWIEEWRELR